MFARYGKRASGAITTKPWIIGILYWHQSLLLMLFLRWNFTIVRMIPALFPAQAIPGYEKIPGIVSMVNGEATTSTFVFYQLSNRYVGLACRFAWG